MSVIKDILQQPKKLCQAPANELTPEEIAWVHSMYYACPKDAEGRLIMNQLKYMPDSHVYLICDWYDDTPFVGTKKSDWIIKREGFEIKVTNKAKGQGYIIDTHNGDVNILRNGMRSHLGTAGYAFQFHMKHYYAVPLLFERGHWANRKTALELGIAVPDRKPLMDALKILFENNDTLIKEHLGNKLLCGIDLNNVEVYSNELTEINKQLAYKG